MNYIMHKKIDLFMSYDLLFYISYEDYYCKSDTLIKLRK